MQRKTKIPVKSLPKPVEWLLRNATGQQLDFLDYVSKHPDFTSLVKLIGLFKDYNIYEVFNYRMRDSDDLAYFRAAKAGEVAGLDAILYVIQAAHLEKKRRKENQ